MLVLGAFLVSVLLMTWAMRWRTSLVKFRVTFLGILPNSSPTSGGRFRSRNSIFPTLILFLGLLGPLQVQGADYCDRALLELNSTAMLSGREYKQPNSRSREEYDSILNSDLRWAVPDRGLILDLGGGQGRAMHQLASEKDINAVVINTQDFNPQSQFGRPRRGTLSYVRGWAEEILPRYEGKADFVVDLWGAFSYSIYKKEILELAFNALKDGGRARILYNDMKTPTWITTRNGKHFDFARWLELRYPDFVRVTPSRDPQYSNAKIIEIVRPPSGRKLILPLRMKHYEMIQHTRSAFPHVNYEEI